MIQFIDLKTQQARIKDKIDKRIQDVLEHGMYIMGPENKELEAKLAEYTGAKHAFAVSSGTDALLLSLMALGVGHGDEVIVPDFSFFATAEVVEVLGAKSIFVDVDPKTYNMDPSQIEAAITDKTKAIMPVSLYGQCAEMNAINEIAKKHGLMVIEDAAQSFGATYHGKKSMNLSDLGCTSFFPAKPLGCYGDGGAITTSNDDLAQKIIEYRNHGQEKRYYHTRIGINGRMDTIQSAILLEKLAIFDDELAKRDAVAKRYDELLKDVADIPYLEEYNTSAWAQYTIKVEKRDEFINKMKEQEIPTSVHYPMPLSKQPALAGRAETCPESQKAADSVVSLPMHPYLDEATQDKIVAAVKVALS